LPAAGARRAHRPKAKARQAVHLPATPGVAYRKQAVGSVTAHIVQVDLNRADVQVTVGVANGGIGRCERWSRIIDRLRPTAAITGTYYDPATFIPVGTIITNGIGVHQGMIGTALTFSADHQARFIRGRLPLSPAGLETVLRAGPRLVDQGRVSLMPSVEGFRDPSIFVRKPRAAVGLTGQNKLLLVAVTRPIYLREMARVMLSLGAYNAMCMDGGSSTGLYYAGKSYQVPRRVMTNVLMVYARPRVARKAVGSG
jgi:exopolysaccharide biosynthesis protein